MYSIEKTVANFFVINERLNTVSIKKDDMTSIIKSLNPTSMGLITSQFTRFSCAGILSHSLGQGFKFTLIQGVFSDTWKITNIIPVHKKEAKNI